jgi:hypothetical protein
MPVRPEEWVARDRQKKKNEGLRVKTLVFVGFSALMIYHLVV